VLFSFLVPAIKDKKKVGVTLNFFKDKESRKRAELKNTIQREADGHHICVYTIRIASVSNFYHEAFAVAKS
jgi:hypothetical protein